MNPLSYNVKASAKVKLSFYQTLVVSRNNIPVYLLFKSEIHDLIDLKDADQTPWDKRKELRQEDETNHFNEDHYMLVYILSFFFIN